MLKDIQSNALAVLSNWYSVELQETKYVYFKKITSNPWWVP